MSCGVSQLESPIHTQFENDSPIPIYVRFRFKPFLVSEKLFPVHTKV